MKVVKRLSDACIAHRLTDGYKGKCSNVHGHNYHFEVCLSSNKLDKYGMVLDFGVIKKMFDSWIQDNWDHCTLVRKDDKLFVDCLQKLESNYYLIDNINPTAEFMSKYLFDKFVKVLDCNIKLESVKVWETDTSYAKYENL